MIRKLTAVPVALLLMMVAACATLGVPSADTFNKKVVVANGIVEQAAKTVETLYLASKISKEDAQSYNARARDAGSAIDLTRQTHTTDPTAADAKLTAIISGLNALMAELQRRESLQAPQAPQSEDE